jgi:hypothetical protein
MKLKLLMAVTISAIAPIASFAQKDDPATQASKPTLEEAQKVVQAIGNDKNKLQAYCDLGKLQEQMEKAEEKNDSKAIDALIAKADTLEQQVGPEYGGIIEGLDPRRSKLCRRTEIRLPYSIPSKRSANRDAYPGAPPTARLPSLNPRSPWPGLLHVCGLILIKTVL